MKTVKNWDGKPVAAYQDADLVALESVFAEAERLWVKEWRDQGSEDRGSCCGGKGIEVRHIGKGCRNYGWVMVVPCDFVQGNMSAEGTVGPAMEYLKAQGVDCKYNDGWMD